MPLLRTVGGVPSSSMRVLRYNSTRVENYQRRIINDENINSVNAQNVYAKNIRSEKRAHIQSVIQRRLGVSDLKSLIRLSNLRENGFKYVTKPLGGVPGHKYTRYKTSRYRNLKYQNIRPEENKLSQPKKFENVENRDSESTTVTKTLPPDSDPALEAYLQKQPVQLKELSKKDDRFKWLDFINKDEAEVVETLAQLEMKRENDKIKIDLLIDEITKGIENVKSRSLVDYREGEFQEYCAKHDITDALTENKEKKREWYEEEEEPPSIHKKQLGQLYKENGENYNGVELPRLSMSYNITKRLRKALDELLEVAKAGPVMEPSKSRSIINDVLVIYLSSTNAYYNNSRINPTAIISLLEIFSNHWVSRCCFDNISYRDPHDAVTLEMLTNFYKSIIRSKLPLKPKHYAGIGFMIYCYSERNFERFETYCNELKLNIGSEAVITTYSRVMHFENLKDVDVVEPFIQSLNRLAPDITLSRQFMQLLMCHYAEIGNVTKFLNVMDILKNQSGKHLDELTFLYFTQLLCRKSYFTSFKKLLLFLLERFEAQGAYDLILRSQVVDRMKSVHEIDNLMNNQPFILYDMHSMVELVIMSYLQALIDIKHKSRMVYLEIQAVIELIHAGNFHIPDDMIRWLQFDIDAGSPYSPEIQQLLGDLETINWGLMRKQFRDVPVISKFSFIDIEHYYPSRRDNWKLNWDVTYQISKLLKYRDLDLHIKYARNHDDKVKRLRIAGKLHVMPGRYLPNDRKIFKYLTRYKLMSHGRFFGKSEIKREFEDSDFDF